MKRGRAASSLRGGTDWNLRCALADLAIEDVLGLLPLVLPGVGVGPLGVGGGDDVLDAAVLGLLVLFAEQAHSAQAKRLHERHGACVTCDAMVGRHEWMGRRWWRADLVSLLLHLECEAVPRQGLHTGGTGLLNHNDRANRRDGGDEILSDEGDGQDREDKNAGFHGPVGARAP